MMNDLAATVRSVRAVLLSHRYAPGEELVWVGGTIRSWDAALVEVDADGDTVVADASVEDRSAMEKAWAAVDGPFACQLGK